MKEIQAFKCDYCGKLYQRKYATLNHEKLCTKNPENFSACSGCKYIEEITLEFASRYDDDEGNAPDIRSKMFHCKKLNKDVYPAIVLRKKLHLKYPEQFENQEQMPSECEFYYTGKLVDDDDYTF